MCDKILFAYGTCVYIACFIVPPDVPNNDSPESGCFILNMIAWLKYQMPQVQPTTFTGRLAQLYEKHLMPLEQHSMFSEFHLAPLKRADFCAKPMVLLLGQYSTGKTSFVRYLLGQNYPSMRIGPEPTTDSFTVITEGDEDDVIPGNVLTVDEKLPFAELARFGGAFLNRFQCARVKSTFPSPASGLSFVDTPGILSGDKQRIDRGYDFASVVTDFISKVDMIILFFDSHKLDISNEFRDVIRAMKGHEEKIRVVLNKADIPIFELMKVHGALLWSLGRVLTSPEVPKVFIGSFWREPLQNTELQDVFSQEESQLMADIESLGSRSERRKLNDLIKRARLAKVSSCTTEGSRCISFSPSFRRQANEMAIYSHLPLRLNL